MKERIVSLVILVVCSFGIFAQEEEQEQEQVQVQEIKKNTFGYSFTLIGAELHYERTLNNYISVLGSVSYTTLFFMDKFSISAKGRWYPFGKIWYLGLGAGYMYGGVSDYSGSDATGGLLAASLFFPPLIILVPIVLIGEVVETTKHIYRESGFLVQTNMGWKIPSRNWALLIDTGLDINVTGISRFFNAVKNDTTGYIEGPEALLHYLMPYLRIGFDFKI